MSLLSKAKLIPVEKLHSKSEADPEVIELAIAYAKHEVTETQAAKAMGVTASKAQSRMRHAITSAIRTGQLTYKK